MTMWHVVLNMFDDGMHMVLAYVMGPNFRLQILSITHMCLEL